MSGNKEGGRKSAESNKQRHGDDYYHRIGAMGGSKGKTGGFYYMKYVMNDTDRIKRLGSKGGRIAKGTWDEII